MPPFIRTKAFLEKKDRPTGATLGEPTFHTFPYKTSENSYFCKTVNVWNTLLREIINIESADRFKKQLSQYT